MKGLLKNLFFIVLGTIIAYLIFKYVAPLVAPFIVALFLAFLIEPVVAFLQRRLKMPRGPSVGISMLAVFGGFGLLIVLAVTRLIIELVHLSAYLPNYINNIKEMFVAWRYQAEAYYLALPADVLNFINDRLSNSAYSLDALLAKAQSATGSVLDFVMGIVSAVPVLVILIVISGIATYFISKDKKLIVVFWLNSIPAPWGRKSMDIVKEVFEAMIVYVRAQALLITITFVQTLIGLYLIGAPYALIMAIIIGVFDLIPILGPSAIYLPWVAWEFASGNSVFAIKLLILYGIVIVVRQILETKIVSSSMGLHPLATMLAMYVGLQLLGATGVIAGPLFLIAVKAFASAGLLGWKKS